MKIEITDSKLYVYWPTNFPDWQMVLRMEPHNYPQVYYERIQP